MVVFRLVWLARITEVAPAARPRTAIAKMEIDTKTSIREKPLGDLELARVIFLVLAVLAVPLDRNWGVVEKGLTVIPSGRTILSL